MTAVALEATRIRIRGATLLAGTVLVVATLVAWWASTPYVVGVWHDDGVYALLGRALASGQGFHYTQLPGAPAATHYPPLYPLLLAAVWRLAPSFPDNIGAFLAVNAVCTGVAALGAYNFTRRHLAWKDGTAAMFALAATLGTPVLALSGALLSEPLFLAALWPTLAAAERAVRADAGPRESLLAGAAVGVLMLVRTHAAALALALVAMLVLRRRHASALRAGGAAVLVLLPWQLWTMVATPRVPALLAGSYGSYLGWFAEGVREGGLPFVVATARINLGELWLLLQDRIVVANPIAPLWLPTLALLALLVVGAWAAARRAPVMVWFLVTYLAVVVVWPYTPWRFLWAVWPVVLACAGAALQRTQELRSQWARLAVFFVLFVRPLVGMMRTEMRAYDSRAWAAPAIQAGEQIVPLVAWVGRNTRRDDVVLSEGEQVVSLFTGRRAAPTASFTAREYVVPRSAAASAAELQQMLTLVPARYVLPLAPVQLDAARALGMVRPGLRPIAALPRSTVYEVVR